MTNQALLDLIARFRIAYAAADREALLAVTTPDFEWHQHLALAADDLPTGRVLVGIEALLAEIVWRGQHWSGVRYSGLEERATDDLLVQTFIISGQADGKPFHAKAVDLYPVTGGRIARKDTYWKYIA